MTFIVLEGGEGSGKSTQAPRLAQWIKSTGREVVLTFEPGDTKTGAPIREVLLHADTPLDARTELLLLLADRAEHVASVIRPALERDAVVVCDRFSPSTLAYQGVARGLGIETVDGLNAFATDGVEPDLVILLDVPDNIAEGRIARARDRMEQAGDDFHRSVRAAYRAIAMERGWITIDGSGEVETVEALVRAAAKLFLP